MSTQVSSPRNARSRKLACSEILLDSGRVELPGDADAIAAECGDAECGDFEDWDDDWLDDWLEDWPYDDIIEPSDQELREASGSKPVVDVEEDTYEPADWDQLRRVTDEVFGDMDPDVQGVRVSEANRFNRAAPRSSHGGIPVEYADSMLHVRKPTLMRKLVDDGEIYDLSKPRV